MFLSDNCVYGNSCQGKIHITYVISLMFKFSYIDMGWATYPDVNLYTPIAGQSIKIGN